MLRLGADPNTITLLHHAEYLANIEDKTPITHRVVVATPEGPRELEVHCFDDDHGIRPWSAGSDYFAGIHAAARSAGLARDALVGYARAEVFEARALVDFGVRWMEANLE